MERDGAGSPGHPHDGERDARETQSKMI
jgi:hypothetical protein